MNKKLKARKVSLAVGLSAAFALTAVSVPDSSPVKANTTKPFVEGWWAWPPQGVLNPFSPNAISLAGFVNSPLAYYTQFDNSYIPEVASSWTMKAKPGDAANGTLTLHLRKGAKWSDGTPITAKDVKLSLELGFVFSTQVSSYIKSISTPDNYTVVVQQNDKPFNLFEQQILTTWVYSAKLWGKYVPSNIQQLYLTSEGTGKAATAAAAKLSALAKKIGSVNVKNYISDGPFTVGQVSSSQILLPKNPYWWAAKNIHMSEWELLAENGNTQAYSYALSGRADYLNTYAPPTVVDPFLAKPGNHIAAPDGNYGPALYFNTSVKPFDDVAVRQAFAYIIDRNEVEQIAYPIGTSSVSAATPTKYPDGMPPMNQKWLTPDTIHKLNPYNKNLAKATKLLESAGLKKVNGSWTYKGKALNLQIATPSAYTDWVAIAENIATQLSQFGINTKLRSVDVTTFFTNMPKGDYTLAIGSAGSSNLSPWYDYGQIMANEGLSINSEGKISRSKTSYNWGPVVQVNGLGKVNVVDLWNQLVSTTDVKKEKAAVNKLAIVVNQSLPSIDLLYNKFYAIFYSTNNWTGYPSANSPLWDINISAGAPALMFAEQGLLKPAH
ncbi:MAG: ABC transporter substrate-binding protein [Alicyclobacillus sp.]|nr:ABC transporter substrate-binding protein [Alicyclobacillus sp.]